MPVNFISEAFRPIGSFVSGASNLAEHSAALSGVAQSRIVATKSEEARFKPSARAGPTGPGGVQKAIGFVGIPRGTATSFKGVGRGVVERSGIKWEDNTTAHFSLLLEKAQASDDVWLVGASVNYRVEYDKWVEVGAAKGSQPQRYFAPALNKMMSETPGLLQDFVFSDKTMNDVVADQAEIMEEEMLSRVPVESGFLKNSIAKKKIREGDNVDVSFTPLDIEDVANPT